MKENLPTINIFFAYSRRDADIRNRLELHLYTLKRKGIIKNWHDGLINPGMEWENEIKLALESADIILLLISVDFIASDYCYDIEMQKAIEKHNNGTSVVIPVIASSCDWEDTPIKSLQVVPKDGMPVNSSFWKNEDEALMDAAKGIKEIVIDLTSRKKRSLIAKAIQNHDEEFYSNEIKNLISTNEKLELELRIIKNKNDTLYQLFGQKNIEIENLEAKLKSSNILLNSKNGLIKKQDHVLDAIKNSLGLGDIGENLFSKKIDELKNELQKLSDSIARDQEDINFQEGKSDSAIGQLELQIRQAKLLMLNERINSKKERKQAGEKELLDLIKLINNANV